MNQDECPICLAHITNDTFTKTSCGHTFHAECLNEWTKNNCSCPLCRQHLLTPLPFWFSRNVRLTIPMIAIPGFVPPQPEILPVEDNNIPMNLLFDSSF